MLDQLDLVDNDESLFGWGGSPTLTLASAGIFLLSLAALFWNESSSKLQEDAIAEAAVHLREASESRIDPSLEGIPVHLSAAVSSVEGVVDPHFDIRSEGVALIRHVSMFQWIEIKQSHGRGKKKRTEYYYEQDWDDEHHDSSKFEYPEGHTNPKPALQSEIFIAADAHFGPYRFADASLVRRALRQIHSRSPDSFGQWPTYQGELPPLSAELLQQRWYQLEADEYYLGNPNEEYAELGDLSVNFVHFPRNFRISMIGAQVGNQIEPWIASNGARVKINRPGSVAATAMTEDAIASNRGARSIIRLAGVVGAMLGMSGMAGALIGFLSAIPLLGQWINVSMRLIGALIGLCIAVVTIAIGWLWARPLIAYGLLLAIAALCAWVIYRARSKRRNGNLRESADTAAPLSALAATPASEPPPSIVTPPAIRVRPPTSEQSVTTSAPPRPSNTPANDSAGDVSRAQPMPTPVSSVQTGKLLRRTLGRKGRFGINKIFKVLDDGTQQVLCYELTRDDKLIKRGTQAEIKAALQQVFARQAPSQSD